MKKIRSLPGHLTGSSGHHIIFKSIIIESTSIEKRNIVVYNLFLVEA